MTHSKTDAIAKMDCSLHPNAVFAVVDTFELLLPPLAIGFNALLLVALVRFKTLPASTRLLLGNLSLALIFSGVATLVGGVNRLANQATGFYPQSTWRCAGVEVARIMSHKVVSVCIAAIALERWLSSHSLQVAKGTGIQARSLIAPLALLWLVCFCLAIEPVTPELTASASRIYCFCDYHDMLRGWQPYIHLVVLTGMSIAQLGAVYGMYRVYRVSQCELESFCLTSVRHNLDERFRTRQNIRVTKLMLPTVWLESACWFVEFVEIIIHFTIWNDGEDHLAAVNGMQLTALIWSIYGALHPLIVASRDSTTRAVIVSWCKQTAASAEAANGGDTVAFHITPTDATDAMVSFWHNAHLSHSHRQRNRSRSHP